jgi:hypothetical protein
MRAFFADSLDKMHVPWAVEGLSDAATSPAVPFLWRTGHFFISMSTAKSLVLWFGGSGISQ